MSSSSFDTKLIALSRYTCILHRVHHLVWHECTTAPEIRDVRDMGYVFWTAIKDMPTYKRRNDNTAVHHRQGPHSSFDELFRRVIGVDWRNKLDVCVDVADWKAGSADFVKRACVCLNLPDPYPWMKKAIEIPAFSAIPTSKASLEEPERMGRDSFFEHGRMQLEFVVDY